SGHSIDDGPPARVRHDPKEFLHEMSGDRYLSLLRERVLVFDGAMGTQLQARELTRDDFGGKEGCNDFLSITRPDVVEDVHVAYFEAGADVVETNSFQASRIRFEEWGLAERTREINRASAEIAHRVAARFEAG